MRHAKSSVVYVLYLGCSRIRVVRHWSDFDQRWAQSPFTAEDTPKAIHILFISRRRDSGGSWPIRDQPTFRRNPSRLRAYFLDPLHSEWNRHVCSGCSQGSKKREISRCRPCCKHYLVRHTYSAQHFLLSYVCYFRCPRAMEHGNLLVLLVLLLFTRLDYCSSSISWWGFQWVMFRAKYMTTSFTMKK